MGLVPQPVTSSSAHTRLIRTLLSSIRLLPPSALIPSLINYTLFPITQILRQNDPSKLPGIFLEAVFELLAPLVSAWKISPGGMDKVAWEQLWRFTVTSIGSSLHSANGANGMDKGKGRAVSSEVLDRAVSLLSALLTPTGDHPSRQLLELVKDAKSSLMPTLFQTVTTLLEIISPVPHLELQLSTLKLLRTLLNTYLVGKSEVLAALLPGTISSIAKFNHAEGRGLKGASAEEALGLVGDVITLTLGDEDLRRLGVLQSKLNDLSQLDDDWVGEPEPPPSPVPSISGKQGPFPPLSASYLDFTSTQLLKALVPILLDLSTHSSHLARGAAANLAYRVVSSSTESLASLVPHCLTTLLLLSRDDFDPLRLDSQRLLRDLLGRPDLQLDSTLLTLLTDAINSFPRLVLSQQDDKVERLAKIATAIAELTSEINRGERNPIARLLGADGQIERWSGGLLYCLEFGRPPSWRSENSTAKRLAEKGWEQQVSTGTLLVGPNGDTEDFPDLHLRHIESPGTYRAILHMLSSMGVAADNAGLHSVEYLVNYSKGNSRGDVVKAVAALWIAQQLLDGIAQGQVQSAEGKVSRATRRMAREVSRVVIAMDTEDEEFDDPSVPDEDQPSDSLVPVERSQGIGSIALLDHSIRNDTHASQETRRLHLQAQQSILFALSLSTLALTSRILSTSFRPLLLNALYQLLAHLASPQSIVQAYADIALHQVAYNTGYAGVQNLILDNVDYVINVVSQRLTHARLSSTAPLVLIAMIRLVGGEIVPMVHDIVDEIFDALDDFHGYEVLASGLLAVLVALIEVMAVEVEANGRSAERLTKMDEARRVDQPPNPAADFARFGKWYEARQKVLNEEIDGILSRAPQHAWGKNDASAEEEANGDDVHMDESDPPPTRSQEVCAQILDKSLNYLSHSSPFLRAKVLSLIARSVPVLAMGNREGDLLPLIDSSWKIILNRLDDIPYVVTEAAQVIAALCEHCGDFMGRRILDQAWPRFKSILEKQQKIDQGSALARRGAIGTESQWTVSHRLHLAILKTALYIVDQVPVSDALLWEMMVLFRPMLDKRAHEEIQAVCMDVYRNLGQRDGDALWVLLSATLGEEKGVWEYLREPGLDIEVKARKLLEII